MNTHRLPAALLACLLIVALLAACGAPAATPPAPKPTAADMQIARPFTLPAAPEEGAVIGPTGGDSQLQAGGLTLGVHAPAGRATRAPAASATPKSRTGGEVLFSDDFSDPDYGGWVTGSEEGQYDIAIADGVMSIAAEQAMFIMQSWRDGETARDLAMEADVEITSGTNASVGFLVRAGRKSSIMFGIDTAGRSRAFLNSDGDWSVPGGGDKNSAINTKRGAVNHLRLVAEGPNYTLFVNDKLVLEVEDDTVSNGLYGFYVVGMDGGASADFDNFVLAEPGAAPADPTDEPGSEVLLSDDFSNNEGGWNVSRGEGYRNRVANGQLSVSISKPNWMAWSTNGQVADNFVLDIDGQWVDGDTDGQYGVVLRLTRTDGGSQFYVFGLMAADGYYFFDGNSGGEWNSLANGWHDAILTEPGDVNHLRVVADGDTLGLWVNDEQIDEVSDSQFAEGYYALFAGSGDEGSYVAAFDNFVLSEVP